ncbi:D-2-hydroxyacid dehydrogenase family protein [Nocardioides bigeumensis]|uniref:D-2-hydroxyacid dehydrogenase family protein n=1 Tax=Nocardioides bigeumensis TaxID=433657 RepID=A0ABN2Y6B4_9ACTN
MTVQIAVLDDYQGVARTMADWSRVDSFARVDVFDEHLGEAGSVVEALQPYDVVVAMRERTRFPADVLERLPGLRLLASTGPVNAGVDLDAARRLGITVTRTDAWPRTTTELAWGLIIALARHLVTEHANVRRGGWQQTVGTDLDGSTLGLLGVGALGSQMATLGKAFGMRVVGWSQHLTSERAAAAGVELVDRDELFARSDFLSIHLVLSDRTRGLVDEAALRSMKPTAYLVNTSRGPIVEERALVAALREGRIAGAGLDVFDQEPLPRTHPLRSLDNVVLTPHIGYVTRGMYRVFFEQVVEVISRWHAGEPVPEMDA